MTHCLIFYPLEKIWKRKGGYIDKDISARMVPKPDLLLRVTIEADVPPASLNSKKKFLSS